MDATLFRRDQPSIRHLLEWDGRMIVEADRFYLLDVERAAAVPLRLPGVEEVVGVSQPAVLRLDARHACR